MYIKPPSAYPYSAAQLRADNPQTSFPDQMPDARLAEWGVFPVVPTAQPEVPDGSVIEELDPVEIAGIWTQQWIVRGATDGETSTRASLIRSERNRRLAECDWTQGKDIPGQVSEQWAGYRQLLRDMSDQPGFPWSAAWPAPPQ